MGGDAEERCPAPMDAIAGDTAAPCSSPTSKRKRGTASLEEEAKEMANPDADLLQELPGCFEEEESNDGSTVEEHTDGSCTSNDCDDIEKEYAAWAKENLSLLEGEPTWGETVVRVLQIVRCHLFTEDDPKQYMPHPTRFCTFNIAFFDLDKESTAEPGPPLDSLSSSDHWSLEDSINVISIKFVETDEGYPFHVYGTVLARDQVDYRCVYLFRRDRDHPQLITSAEDMLSLTGPYRALAGKDSMFFEFNLKTIDNEGVDKDISKGVLEHNATCHTKKCMTRKLSSCSSTLEFVYTPVPLAVQASIAVNILKGPSNSFSGKITASTTGNSENDVILYDSEVDGTEIRLGDGGSVALTCGLVAVSLDEELLLNFSFYGGDNEAEPFELVLGQEDVDILENEGPYELQVKIDWTGVIARRRKNMWGYVGRTRVLL